MRHAVAILFITCLIGGRAGAVQPVIQPGDRVAGPRSLLTAERRDVAVAGDGGYLVTWQEDGLIYARAFHASGTARAGATQLRFITGRLTGYGSDPRAAGLADGRFVVAWVDTPDPFVPLSRVTVRLVDGNGAPLGPPVTMEPPTAAYPPALVVDAAGVATVAWTSFDFLLPRRIHLRRLDATRPELPAVGWPGAPGLDVVDGGDGFQPSLALVPGGVVLARPVSNTTIAVTLLGLDAQPRAAERRWDILAPQDLFNELVVATTADETGRFVVAWHELQRPEIDRVRAQRFAADGSPVGGPVDLVTRNELGAGPDRAIVLGDVESRRDGTLLVTWTLGRVLTYCANVDGFGNCTHYAEFVEGADVYAGVFAADGTSFGRAQAPPGVRFLNVAYDRAGGAAVAGDGWVMAYAGLSLEAAKVAFTPCGADAASLCLDNRFRLQVEWQTGDFIGFGSPLSLTSDTGAFWFFSPSNVELVAKVLDGTGVNGKHWVFFASLTDVEFDLVVTDTATGAVKRYHNPQGTLASRADIGAFDGGASLAAISGPMSSALGGAAVLAPSSSAAAETSTACPTGALCLADGRFVVTAKWRLDGSEGAATPIGWTGETGTFWFFSPSNVELAVKVLDGRGVNGRFWVFYASLSDVDFDLEVLDTTTGARRTYHNPRGTMASRADVNAF